MLDLLAVQSGPAAILIKSCTGVAAQPPGISTQRRGSPRPRLPSASRTFWAIDDTTEQNGATEIIPGSHLWDGEYIEGAVKPTHFTNRAGHEEGDRTDAVNLIMPSGSLAITKGTLWHRGGANRSDRPRLIVTPQYCVGWVRQLRTWRSPCLPTWQANCRSAPAS